MIIFIIQMRNKLRINENTKRKKKETVWHITVKNMMCGSDAA